MPLYFHRTSGLWLGVHLRGSLLADAIVVLAMAVSAPCVQSADRCAPLSERQSTCQLLKGCLFSLQSTPQLCTNGKDVVADSSSKLVLRLVPHYQSAVQRLLDTLLWRHRETGCCSRPGPNFLLQQLHQLVQLPVIAAHLPADHQLKLLRQLGQ